MPQDALVVEWAGRSGHPTSYALLGARPTIAGVTVSLPSTAVAFPESLAGVGDTVFLNGLLDEYFPAFVDVLGEDTEQGWEVLTAAAGEVGSSINAFRWVARFFTSLHQILESEADPSNESLWTEWDQARPS